MNAHDDASVRCLSRMSRAVAVDSESASPESIRSHHGREVEREAPGVWRAVRRTDLPATAWDRSDVLN